MSRALQAAVHEARERIGHLMDFARGSMNQIEDGLPPPSAADMKAYRDLTLSALRKLTKFPRAVIPLSALLRSRGDASPEQPLAPMARRAIAALSLGLIGPDDLIFLTIALGKVRELDPTPGRRRGPLLLPERAGGGPTVRDLFGEAQ